jgi:hypothetical protein
MSIHAGRAKLNDAANKLKAGWQVVHEQWDDTMSRDFAARSLTPLEPSIRSTLGTMEQMGEVLRKIRRDCGTD